jgi:histidine triad (HIT) family protein
MTTTSKDGFADSCAFCRIVARKSPTTIIAEWADAIAIAPLNPVTPGHLLIIPKQHVADVTQNPQVSAATMRAAAELATAPCNIITSAGPEATQTVFHLHLHVVPRRAADGLCLPWTHQERNRDGDV